VTTPQHLIEKIHAAGRPLVLAVTGGGSGAISSLLEVPGASASVLEAIVPYAGAALAEWLGGKPDHYCSERTARAMAMAAFERARELSDADVTTLRGIGATASLASNRPKRGAHRIHVGWQSAETTAVVSCTFPSDITRADEEQLSTQLVLSTVGEACGGQQSLPSSLTNFEVTRREQRATQEWSDLLLRRRNSVAVSPAGADTMSPMILFPGAFNPLHKGHQQMAKVAAKRCGKPVTFELSVANVDKPPLDFIEIADRLGQLPNDRVLLTRAPTFVEKAEIAPASIFVVGIDTLVRIGDPVYYDNDPAKRDAAIAAIRDRRCRFLVFGRAVDGAFSHLSDFDVPPELRELCDEVREAEFREDISSTRLRSANEQTANLH
jgi:nicotinamide mononucleotide (NMN) deamidase PncC